MVAPLPLVLEQSNFHPRLSPSANVQRPIQSQDLSCAFAPPSPSSPDFKAPTQEEVRQRRLEKLMRTLGEGVPAELVNSRAGLARNLSIFPEPPLAGHSYPSQDRGIVEPRLKKRASFTLSSHVSSLTDTFLPKYHTRTRSRDIPTLGDVSPPMRLKRRPANIITPTRDEYLAASHSSNARPRPETLMSPIVFARPYAPNPIDGPAPITPFRTPKRNGIEQDTVTKLTRRASVATSVISPSSPYFDRFREPLIPSSPRSVSSQSTNFSDYIYLPASPRSARPQSIAVAPVVFDKHDSTVLLQADAHGFGRLTDNEDEDEDDQTPSGDHAEASSRTSPNTDTGDPQSNNEHGYQPRSDLHMIPARPETPFANSWLSPNETSEAFKPVGTLTRKNSSVVRKEQRQGWSGEWNRSDMQEVIQKLRNLK